MKSIKNTFIRGLSLLLALILVLNVPVAAFATEIASEEVFDSEAALISEDEISTVASSSVGYTEIEDMMKEEAFKALKYLGYDKNNDLYKSGKLFVLTGKKVEQQYPNSLTGIGYSSNGHGYEETETKPTGYAAVNSATSATGMYPDVATFKSTGLDCVDYAAYYLTNYLRNIEGWNLQWLDDILTTYKAKNKYYAYDHMDFWPAARNDLIKAGVDVYEITGFSTSKFELDGETYEKKAITKYNVYKDKDTKGYSVNNSKTDIYSLLEPGDLIQMGEGLDSSDDKTVHYAIYAGTYDGTHYMYHCGNNRGPEINIIENMWTYMAGKDKQSMPLYFYHFDKTISEENYGKVSVKKDDPDGKPLAGAKFLLTYEDGRYWELETDATGSASVEDLPLGKYSIKETVSPPNYVLDSTVKSFTLTKDKATYTYSLTNKLATSSPRRKSIDFRPPRKRGGQEAAATSQVRGARGECKPHKRERRDTAPAVSILFYGHPGTGVRTKWGRPCRQPLAPPGWNHRFRPPPSQVRGGKGRLRRLVVFTIGADNAKAAPVEPERLVELDQEGY